MRGVHPSRQATPSRARGHSPLSAATYFGLLAQGRLVDGASSSESATALRHGCVTSLLPALPVVASKCGIWRGYIHDVLWARDASVQYADATDPETGVTAILLSQRLVEGPAYSQIFHDFFTHAYAAAGL